jgi:hypothetical protein
MRRSVGYFGAGMDPKFTLPSEMVRDASISGNEYGWPLRAFPNAVRQAESLMYACLGGQFQFRAQAGTCEMYWLSANPLDRQPSESWKGFSTRSCAEVLNRFEQIVSETDFAAQALQWPALKSEMERGFDVIATLVFVAYFVTEPEWLTDRPPANQNPS